MELSLYGCTGQMAMDPKLPGKGLVIFDVVAAM
jgi:hypothetical protein